MTAGGRALTLARWGTGNRTGKEQAGGTDNLRGNQGQEQAEHIFSLKEQTQARAYKTGRIVPLFACSRVLPVPSWWKSKGIRACAEEVG